MSKPKAFCLTCLLTEMRDYLEYQQGYLADLITDAEDDDTINGLSSELHNVMEMLSKIDFALPSQKEHEGASLH